MMAQGSLPGTRRASTQCVANGFPTSDVKGMQMKAIAAIVISAVLAMLAGCNTVEGAGKDVKATGAAVERAADKSKPY